VKKILSVLLVLLLAGQVIAGPSRSSSSSSSSSSRSSGGFRSLPSSPSPRSSTPSSSSSSRSSGGFRSSPTPPSSPKPPVTYTPKPSSTPKSAASTQATPKPTDRVSGGFKTESPTKVTPKVDPPKSSLDKALFNKTKEAGTTKPRAEQIQEFKAKNASKYTSEYKQEPKSRPEHIPQTYTSGGNSYNIVYNPGRGYGYWTGGPGLGTFMLYDAMSDAIMLNALMSRPAVATYTPVYGAGGGSEVIVTHSYVPQIFGLLFLAVFIGVVCYVIKNG
jgi:hypothetical protein